MYRVRAEFRDLRLGDEFLLDGGDDLVPGRDGAQQRSLWLGQHTRHLTLLYLQPTSTVNTPSSSFNYTQLSTWIFLCLIILLNPFQIIYFKNIYILTQWYLKPTSFLKIQANFFCKYKKSLNLKYFETYLTIQVRFKLCISQSYPKSHKFGFDLIRESTHFFVQHCP